MGWQLTDDVEEFRTAADPCLALEPARSTLLLTISESVRAHGAGAGASARFGHWRESEDAPVSAGFVQTPPLRPLLGPMPDRAARELVPVLRALDPSLSSVQGEEACVRAFAAEWTGCSGGWHVSHRVRLFRLGELTPPDPAPAGRARLATAEDLPLLAEWMSAFATDTGQAVRADEDYTRATAERIAVGRLWLWDVAGAPVAMASVTPTVAGQARVSPVYTPLRLRGRGYGGAVTAAVSRAARDAGAEQVLLYTDLANPTSNALYQRLGYRPLTDSQVLTFDRGVPQK
ncbi:N-acetyltransferase [Streptomyces camponoticapitis]|uniref:N-acetyltransferase n=1 Tax=Streptomyces camponoticapitis TaxID=1616125 RepID=A0ABQ2E6G7_9ACTN|nr:GNAT family N-acetyltransferase [Streptomyces camponoticapitis]GGJ98071.1 N-acetyltransferase [Streptomyces camponoticapitis]